MSEARPSRNESGPAGSSGEEDQNEVEYMFLPLWRTICASRNAVDVGGHVGNFSRALLDAGFDVTALEPHPLIYAGLVRRFSGNPAFRALNVAATSVRRVLYLNTAEFVGEDRRDQEREGLYSALRKHPVREAGLDFQGGYDVTAWPLADLAAAGQIPSDIGVLKVDTEGHDAAVLAGLGSLSPEIVLCEFWNEEFVFNRGRTRNDMPDYRALMDARGYAWNLTLYRQGPEQAISYRTTSDETPPNSWGNIVFFRSEEAYEASLQWLSEVHDGKADDQVITDVLRRASMWRQRLSANVRALRETADSSGEGPVETVARPLLRSAVDVIVSPNEISAAHGTGILLKRLIEDQSDIVCIRSQTTYDGRQDYKAKASFVLPNPAMDRAEITEQVARWVRGYDVKHIVCVPYYQTDLLIALALKAVSGAPMALWIMDDHCIFAGGIKREIMREAIDRADAVFAISPELRQAYESEFGKKIWVAPPLVAPGLIRETASEAPADLATTDHALIIGNIWSQAWFDRVCDLIGESGWRVTWYASNEHPSWLSIDEGRLEAAGISIKQQPQMDRYIEAVCQAPFVIVPSGDVSDGTTEAAIARLSLPTRVPFTIATAGTPLLVLGDANSAAARIVTRLGLGETAPYEKAAFEAAAERLRDPERQREIRERAAALAPKFSSRGAYDYLKSAAQSGGYIRVPAFDTLFPALPGDYSVYRDPPVPPSIHPAFAEIYEFMARLARQDYRPDFVIDVGASTGIWSYYVAEVFPDATFLLVEPMFSRYPATNLKPGFILVEKAASDQPGHTTFKVSDDLYNSSLVGVSNVAKETQSIDIEIATVDQLFAEHGLSGNGILKVDVQYAEHLVLAGARDTLARHADFVILELTFDPPVEGALNFVDMLKLMDDFGFRPFDDVGGWRSPKTGFSDQKDFVFCRKDLKLG